MIPRRLPVLLVSALAVLALSPGAGEAAAVPVKTRNGMVVSANGQILTNEHVVASADEVSVELA